MNKRTTKEILMSDVNRVAEKYPKLRKLTTLGTGWSLEGVLDICDAEGEYWDSFEIEIIIPHNYPNGVPLVFEKGLKIPRINDRHIFDEGCFCLDIPHNLLFSAHKGVNLLDFISTKIYPFLANQIYFELHGKFAGQEFKHGFEGVQQFYAESGILNNHTAVKILLMVLEKRILDRNDLCLCGSDKKYKNCHLHFVEQLSVLGYERLLLDLKGFRNAKADYSFKN